MRLATSKICRRSIAAQKGEELGKCSDVTFDMCKYIVSIAKNTPFHKLHTLDRKHGTWNNKQSSKGRLFLS